MDDVNWLALFPFKFMFCQQCDLYLTHAVFINHRGHRVRTVTPAEEKLLDKIAKGDPMSFYGTGFFEYCFNCGLLVCSDGHKNHARALIDVHQLNDLINRGHFSDRYILGGKIMSSPQPPINATIEAHQSDWQSILAAVFQGIQIMGPFVIQLVEAEKGTAQVTFHTGVAFSLAKTPPVPKSFDYTNEADAKKNP